MEVNVPRDDSRGGHQHGVLHRNDVASLTTGQRGPRRNLASDVNGETSGLTEETAVDMGAHQPPLNDIDPMIEVELHQNNQDGHRLKFDIRKSTLVAESRCFEECLRNSTQPHAERLDLASDCPQAFTYVFSALSMEQPSQNLRQFCQILCNTLSPTHNRIDRETNGMWSCLESRKFEHTIVENIYTITDKYEMPALHLTVVQDILPVVLELFWNNCCSAHGPLPAADFIELHYRPFSEKYGEYPKELWPIFTTAFLRYQQFYPECTVISDILDQCPALAKFIQLDLAKSLNFANSRVKELEAKIAQLEGEGIGMEKIKYEGGE